MPMPNKIRGIVKDKGGFTGLEAAIVLTAFIVVAAVFSYMVLGAGFFSTEKAKEVVHTGVEKATSSVDVAGDVIGHGWKYYINDGNVTLGNYNTENTNNFTDGDKLGSSGLTLYAHNISATRETNPSYKVNITYINASGGTNSTITNNLIKDTGDEWVPITNITDNVRDITDIEYASSNNVTACNIDFVVSLGYNTYYALGAYGSDTTNLTVMEFQVTLTAGQEAINMRKAVLSYSDSDTYNASLPLSRNVNASKGNLTMGTWNYTLATAETGRANMLDPGEKMTIIVSLPEYGVKVDKEFKIDLKPPKGSTIAIVRRAPSAIYKTMLLR